MVIGGYYNPYLTTTEYPYTTEDPYPYTTEDRPEGPYLSDVELLSLDSDNPVPPCLMSLNNFPVGLFGASGSVGDGNMSILNMITHP